MAHHNPKLTLDKPASYRISVQGYLGQDRSDYLQGMTITTGSAANQPPVTILTGQLVDQAALLGVLNGLYGLGYPLLSVECK